MKSKTVKALRALAKERGIKGYSKLSKEELLRRLQTTEPRPSPAAETKAYAAGTEATPPPKSERPVARPAAERSEDTGYRKETPPWWEPSQPAARQTDTFSSEEERVEGAKYTLPPGSAAGTGPATDLGEDIDRLPALREPVLCLLPQKPGILHAYWVLPDGAPAGRDLKLRLCRSERDRLDVWEELPLPAEHGSWYFHVPDSLQNHEVVLQLGYYRDRDFVSAIHRGIARIPSLYASTSTDRWWWIAEEDFRRLYLNAGGFEAGVRRYGWEASVGSPGAPPPGPGEERLGWPGGVSSR